MNIFISYIFCALIMKFFEDFFGLPLRDDGTDETNEFLATGNG